MQITHRQNSSASHRVRKSAATTDDSAENDNSPSRVIQKRDTATTASEEDVFSRLVSDEVTRTQSATTQTEFAKLVEKQLKIRTRADGSVNWEKVMKGALKWASNDKQKLITSDDAEKIYSRTFAAAQLDSNSSSLDDSSVSAAVMSRDLAFTKARTSLEKMVSGEIATPTRSLLEKATSSVANSYKTQKNSDDNLKDIILSNIDFQI